MLKSKNRRNVFLTVLILLWIPLAVLGLKFFVTFGHYKIPSQSMMPTLEVGDHIYVSQYEYGLSKKSVDQRFRNLPFVPKEGIIFSKLPMRGDVVAFRNPYSNLIMIKRLIGLPGDTLVFVDGRIQLNGELVERNKVEARTYRDSHFKTRTDVIVYTERFPGEEQPHIIYEVSDYGNLDNAGEFTVPDGMVFFLGDNRDNSIDSRAPFGAHIPSTGPGFVPLDHLIGRADLIMFSLKRCKKEEGFHCPGRRFLTGL